MKTMALILALSLGAPGAFAGPRRHFWQSKTFWAAFAVDTGAMFFDYAESQRAFARGARERDPMFFADRPGMGRMTAIGLPGEFLTAYGAFRLHNSNEPAWRPLAWVAVAGVATVHLASGAESANFPDRPRK